MSYTFGQDDQADRVSVVVPPWLIDRSEDSLIEWTKNAWDVRSQEMAPHWEAGRENLARFLGFYWVKDARSSTTTSINGKDITFERFPRIGINFTRRLVEQKVSKINKAIPKTVVAAANPEDGDTNMARTAQAVLDYHKYKYPQKQLNVRHTRRTLLFGEAYKYFSFNKELGPIKGSKKTVKVPDAQGKKISIDKFEREGEVETALIRHEDIVFLLGWGMQGVMPYATIQIRHRPIMEVKAAYPEKADKIKASTATRFNYGTLQDDQLADHVTEYIVHVRANCNTGKGYYWVCTDNVMLEEFGENPMPYTAEMEASEMGNLPYERLTDVDVEGGWTGLSSLSDINQLQTQYDRLTTFIMRSIWLFSNPKFIVPRGGVNIEALHSGAGFVVQSSGPFQPYVATYPVISNDVLTMWRALPELGAQQYDIFDHSLGRSPANARTAGQLMIYDEQEEETREIFKGKLEQNVVNSDTKVLALCSMHYKTEKYVQILGENNRWSTVKIRPDDLRSEMVVRKQITSIFPEEPAQQRQFILQLGQYYPTLMRPEQILDKVAAGDQERYIDWVTVAVRSAQDENEALMRGEEVKPPEFYEDQIAHWPEHAKMFQSLSFKNAPEKIKKRAEAHMLATETLMMDQARQNPACKQELLSPLYMSFPMFYVQEDLQPQAPLGVQGSVPTPVDPEMVPQVTQG